MGLAPPVIGYPDPVVLSTMSDDLCKVSCAAGAAGAAAIWPVANVAYFYPIRIAQARTYRKAWWLNGATVAGNVDVGIYTISGTTATRVVASTAEAQAGASVMQVAATFTTTTLQPGLYYLAMSCTSTTSTFWRTNPGTPLLKAAGMYQTAAASPLPATPTVAAIGSSWIPTFGFSELTTI